MQSFSLLHCPTTIAITAPYSALVLAGVLILGSFQAGGAQPLEFASHGQDSNQDDSLLYSSPQATYKRAGFVGMRGKKSSSEERNEFDRTSSHLASPMDESEFRAIAILQHLLAVSPSPAAGSTAYLRRSFELPGDLYKRGSSAGFVGMRGKKSDEEEALLDESNLPALYPGQMNKRSGFVGMRGKKMLSSSFSPFWSTVPSVERFNLKMRRGGSAGFVGMRG